MSKFLGRVQIVDGEGRISLPSDMMEQLQIKAGGEVEILANSEYIFIRTADVFCDMCKGNTPVYPVGRMKICTTCSDTIAQNYMQRLEKE